MNETKPDSSRPDSPRRSGSRAGWILIGCALVLGAGGVALWLRLAPAKQTAYVPAAVKPNEFVPAAQSLGVDMKFVDVTESAGIRFRHVNGARGKKLLPETMGGACAFIDFDRDGDQDLLFVNSAPWPGDAAEGARATQALYANDGKGRFTDVSESTGLAASFYGMGVAIGDYDGDGWDDIFFTGVGGEHLYRNVEGKRFEDATAAAGLPSDGPNSWSTGAAFLDYDNDGRLDLFFCRYVEWSPAADLAQAFQISGLDRAYGPPQNFGGTYSKLYRNAGSRFEDVSQRAGIQVKNPATGEPMGKGLGAAVQDFNCDGWPDIAVANDTVQNYFFINNKDGTFEESAMVSGFAFDEAGKTRGAMGVDCASLGRPGSMAIVVGNFANEVTALYRSESPCLIPFSDDATSEGIGNPSRKHMKFGVFFFDFDLDGRQDIFEANGHLESEIEKVQATQKYAQPVQIFWNAGPDARRGFEVLGPEKLGPDLFQPVVGRGCAYGDIDGDGDLDVALAVNGGPARVFRNDGGDRNNWVRIKVTGTKGNTNALGARVTAEVAGRKVCAQVASGRSYLSQCEQVVTFGLGRAEKLENVQVYWPGSSAPQNLGPLPARSFREVKQP